MTAENINKILTAAGLGNNEEYPSVFESAITKEVDCLGLINDYGKGGFGGGGAGGAAAAGGAGDGAGEAAAVEEEEEEEGMNNSVSVFLFVYQKLHENSHEFGRFPLKWVKLAYCVVFAPHYEWFDL